MSRADQIRFAAHAWDYALRLRLSLSLSLRTTLDGPEREALLVCEERPSLPNIRAALAIGRGRTWLPLIESGVGFVAIEEILGS